MSDPHGLCYLNLAPSESIPRMGSRKVRYDTVIEHMTYYHKIMFCVVGDIAWYVGYVYNIPDDEILDYGHFHVSKDDWLNVMYWRYSDAGRAFSIEISEELVDWAKEGF